MIKMALLRGIIPFIIMTGIALLLNFQEQPSDARSTFLAAIIAFFVAAASVIYDLEHWSLLKQSIVHFVIMLITTYPVLLVSGWFSITSFSDALIVLMIFIGVGIVLWSIFFTIFTIFKK